MRRSPAELESDFDVAVIGGGVFGASIARDAAQRGLTVALIERDDFCGQTSAHSFRMIHGGIRYLQHADLPRLRESAAERRALLRTAPHLTRPLPIAVPTYRGLMRGRTALRCGMALYDLLTADRNRGIADPARRIPRGRMLSRSATLERFPGLDDDGLTGAGLFVDGQMYNPTRLGLAMVQAAAADGAVVANRVAARRILRDGRRVVGVEALDRATGRALTIRASQIVNAAGPWAPGLLQGLALSRPPRPTFSRDLCFVVRRRLVGEIGLTVPAATGDPDALVSRGKRHLFLVPWRGEFTLVGVWHVVHTADPDDVGAGADEIRGYLDELRAGYPALQLELADVAQLDYGLVRFGDNEEGAVDLSYGKRSDLIDHGAVDGLAGLWTVIGVRWTTARGVAERLVDRLLPALGRPRMAGATATTPLPGGDIDDMAALDAEARERAPAGTDPRILRALVRNHGTGYRRILDAAGRDPRSLGPLGGTTVLGAEVVAAIDEEMAEDLQDIALRRTDLATAGHPGRAALDEAARIAGERLGWDADRRRGEIEALESTFPDWSRRA